MTPTATSEDIEPILSEIKEIKRRLAAMETIWERIDHVDVETAGLMLGKERDTVYAMLKDPSRGLAYKRDSVRGIRVFTKGILEYNFKHTIK